MKLVIKGHATHGKKVIEILEMLGGINELDLKGTEAYSYYYIDDSSNNIYCVLSVYPNDYNVYSLEEFLEKFPYKVGDKVKAWINGYHSICYIQNMQWDSIANEIKYKIQDYWYSAMNLQPYKEENMEQIKIDIPEGYEFFGIDDNDKVVFTKIQPKYPKTYVECEKILRCFSSVYIEGYKTELLEVFQKLLICRDAYWKIAGEEMGLGKHWEPTTETVYCISRNDNVIKCSYRGGKSNILEFPTPEMRDAFYENFKVLIENCKELL